MLLAQAAALDVLGLLLRDVEVVHLVALVGLPILVRLLLVVLHRIPLSVGEPSSSFGGASQRRSTSSTIAGDEQAAGDELAQCR